MKSLSVLVCILFITASCRKQQQTVPPTETPPPAKTVKDLLQKGKWLLEHDIIVYNVDGQTYDDTADIRDCELEDTLSLTMENYFLFCNGPDSCSGQNTRPFSIDTFARWSLMEDRWLLLHSEHYNLTLEIVAVTDSTLAWETRPLNKMGIYRKSFYRNGAHK